MKKILLTTLMMLLSVVTWAQEWVAPSESEYPNETPVYVQVNVNGSPNTSVQVAAFIGEECRAVASQPMTVNNNTFYRLRVWGDLSTENGKAITFKVGYQGIVYKMTKTINFTGETYSTIPFVLNVDVPTGLEITNPINIEAKLPSEHDLTNDIRFLYNGNDVSGAPVEYTPLGESSIETPLTYEWDFGNSGDYISVAGMTLTAWKATEEGGAYLGLNINELALNGYTTVIITEPTIPVESITANPSQFTMTIYDNLYEMESVLSAITVLPEDASNKAYRFEAADDAAQAVFEGGSFTDGGTYNIKVVSEADESIFTTIQVTVVVPAESLVLSSPSNRFFAVPDENVFELIRPYVMITPENATNKGFHFTVPDEASDAIVDGVAKSPGIYSLRVVSDESENLQTEVEVVVNQIQAPQSISINVGEYYRRALEGQIQVLPSLPEMSFTYEIAPKSDTDATGFDGQGMATQSGTYTMVVTCIENPKATAEIQVKVVTPVVITFPANIEMSTLRDTQLTLSLEEGDDFNPELVEIEFASFSDMAYMVGEPTAVPVDGSDRLKWNLHVYTCGIYGVMVKYNGEYMLNSEGYQTTEVQVMAEVAFNNAGWDWIYIPGTVALTDDSQNYLSWLNQDANNRIIDLRSQTALLYNDATLGLFGDIQELTTRDGMYKIKAQYANEVSFNTQNTFWENMSSRTIVKGYTWFGYPNEWDLAVSDYNTYIIDGNTTAVEGDQIIGKEGFAEFDGTEWVASQGFYFQKGKGYIYFTESIDERDLDFGDSPIVAQTPRMQIRSMAQQQKAESVWQYDASEFADNMAIVAELTGILCPEDYTIGAFVGNECRGEGFAVKGGRMMINVAGKPGETISFKLHNTNTDEYFDITEKITYAGRIGSLSSPLALNADMATGIITNEMGEGKIEAIYDTCGRAVNEMTKGTYIIKVRKNNQIITKKVIK